MTIGEYEERFWRTAPSVHQTFAASRGRDQRRRRLRIWVAAATVAVLSITCSVANASDWSNDQRPETAPLRQDPAR
jgi:hypothetical protein